MKRFVRQLLKSFLPSAKPQRKQPRPGVAISPVARGVKDARLTYLNDEKLARIEKAIDDVARAGVPGAFLECGIALGGSSIVIATLMPQDREFRGYDLFGMIPPPASENDDEKSKARYEVIKSGQSRGIGGDTYYGYIDNLYEHVKENFNRFNLAVDDRRISLHKGTFEEALHPPPAVAFAHIDCDWYDPVKLCLERIFPRLSAGGYIILDDYNDYGGCRKAADEFMAHRTDIEVVHDKPNFTFRRQHQS